MYTTSRAPLLVIALAATSAIGTARSPAVTDGAAAPGAAPRVVVAELVDDGGVAAIGRVLHANGGLTLYADLPDGTPITLWALDGSGAPIAPLLAAVWEGKARFFGASGDPIGDLPFSSDAIAFSVDVLDANGGIDRLAVGVLEWTTPDDTIDATGGRGGLSANSGGTTAAVDEGGNPAGYTFKCMKKECELKMILTNGTTIIDTLDKDDSAFVSAAAVIYAVCSCM